MIVVFLLAASILFIAPIRACVTDADCVSQSYSIADTFSYCDVTTGGCVVGCSAPYLQYCTIAMARPLCADLRADPNNCGACFRRCSSGPCVDGTCTSGNASCPRTNGVCPANDILPPPVPKPNVPVSTDGKCGPTTGTRCPLGQCCDSSGACSMSDCAQPGCQLYYGSCIGVPPFPEPCPLNTKLSLVEQFNTGGPYIWSYKAAPNYLLRVVSFTCQGCPKEGTVSVWDATINQCVPVGSPIEPGYPICTSDVTLTFVKTLPDGKYIWAYMGQECSGCYKEGYATKWNGAKSMCETVVA